MQPIARPTRAEALVAFIKKHVHQADSTIEELHKTATARLAGAYISSPVHSVEFFVDCRILPHAWHYHSRDTKRDLNADLALAFATLVVEAARQKGQPDVQAAVDFKRDDGFMKVTLSVDYLGASSPI